MAEETKNLPVRGNRKERVGEVVSNKMAKTIVVRVERRFPHAQYKKIVTAYKKFYAHDEKNEAKVGDRVAKGDSLATVHASDRKRRDDAVERLRTAFEIGETIPAPRPLIHSVLE